MLPPPPPPPCAALTTFTTNIFFCFFNICFRHQSSLGGLRCWNWLLSGFLFGSEIIEVLRWLSWSFCRLGGGKKTNFGGQKLSSLNVFKKVQTKSQNQIKKKTSPAESTPSFSSQFPHPLQKTPPPVTSHSHSAAPLESADQGQWSPFCFGFLLRRLLRSRRGGFHLGRIIIIVFKEIYYLKQIELQ